MVCIIVYLSQFKSYAVKYRERLRELGKAVSTRLASSHSVSTRRSLLRSHNLFVFTFDILQHVFYHSNRIQRAITIVILEIADWFIRPIGKPNPLTLQQRTL